MSNKREILLWVLVVISLVVGSASFFTESSVAGDAFGTELKKVGYVELSKVFEGVEMKLELQQKLEKDLMGKKGLVDSLMFQLSTLKNELENQKEPSKEKIEQFYQLQAYYAKQKETFDQYQLQETQNYDAQILGQMTQYIKDFGNENGYDFIFGDDNTGNILYGRPAADITSEVIEFINQKYQGKN